MKIFATLSDIHKERALHMAEHIILDGLLENGFEGTPETDDEKEHFSKMQEALNHAKTLDEDAQAEYLFDHPIAGDLILDKAYQVATTALYIEEDEVAFHIDEIDRHFGNDDEEALSSLEEETKDDEELSSISSSSEDKNSKHWN